MDENFLAAGFEAHRPHLRAVAYRVLGSATEADDAVQEAWLRLSRADTSDVENLGGWLTTVVARVCLNMLQSRRRQVVAAFLAASRGGDFDGLLALLDPDVVLRADAAGVRMGAPAEVRGGPAVAETFSGRARAAQPALINGEPGVVWAVDGRPRMVFAFTIMDGDIIAIDMIADPDRLGVLDIEVFE